MTSPQRSDGPTSTTGPSSPPEVTEIVVGGAVIECFLVPWDSSYFGFPVAQIRRVDLGTEEKPSGVFRAFDAWCEERDVRLVSCRLDHTRLRESMALEEHGFRFIEMVYQPRLDSFDGLPAPSLAIEVGEAGHADLGAIDAIASTAFTTGRFLLDPRLPPDSSNRRYAGWVQSSFENPNHTVLKAEVEGELIGFFIVEDRPDGSAYWHLTAIAPGSQGKGLGRSLWLTMLHRHRAAGATAVETTISAHNAPVMNLYARLGFTFSSAQMTFHRLRGQAAAAEPAT